MSDINGVLITELKQINTPKGDVWHALKKIDNGYEGFGEAYFSFVRGGQIKGWRKHTKMTLNLIVPSGAIKFRLIDDRNNESTFQKRVEVTLSPDSYCRLTVPPNVWMCFEGIAENNMLLNIASIIHDPEEAVSLPIEAFSL